MNVDREKVLCQSHRNLILTILCPIKTVRKGSTMWVRFIIWIFTTIELKGSERVILTLSSTTLAIPQVIFR